MAIIEVHGQGGDALQLAVNSASTGDTIQVWGDPALPYSGHINCVTKKLTIIGMNGKENCIIDGGHTYDEATDTHTGTYCVRSTNTAAMSTINFFTIQNGSNANDNGGGCIAMNVNNCIIQKCYANNGAGGSNCNITNSIIRNNQSKGNGGGTSGGTAVNCEIYDNIAKINGSGGNSGTFNNCMIYNNRCENTNNNYGGGIRNSTANNCIIRNNTNAVGNYENTYSGTYTNCLIVGGGCTGVFTNCTFVCNKNFCVYLSSGQLKNCILYNTNPSGQSMLGHNATDRTNYWNTLFYPAVTSNLVDAEAKQILNGVDPLLDSTYHLRKSSPCIGAGNADYLQSATDLDGKDWKVPPSIGCYEFYGSKQYLPSSLHPLGV